MKLFILMFVFLCIHTSGTVKGAKKVEAVRKEAKPAFNLAPSILIINY